MRPTVRCRPVPDTRTRPISSRATTSVGRSKNETGSMAARRVLVTHHPHVQPHSAFFAALARGRLGLGRSPALPSRQPWRLHRLWPPSPASPPWPASQPRAALPDRCRRLDRGRRRSVIIETDHADQLQPGGPRRRARAGTGPHAVARDRRELRCRRSAAGSGSVPLVGAAAAHAAAWCSRRRRVRADPRSGGATPRTHPRRSSARPPLRRRWPGAASRANFSAVSIASSLPWTAAMRRRSAS